MKSQAKFWKEKALFLCPGTETTVAGISLKQLSGCQVFSNSKPEDGLAKPFASSTSSLFAPAFSEAGFYASRQKTGCK